MLTNTECTAITETVQYSCRFSEILMSIDLTHCFELNVIFSYHPVKAYGDIFQRYVLQFVFDTCNRILVKGFNCRLWITSHVLLRSVQNLFNVSHILGRISSEISSVKFSIMFNLSGLPYFVTSFRFVFA